MKKKSTEVMPSSDDSLDSLLDELDIIGEKPNKSKKTTIKKGVKDSPEETDRKAAAKAKAIADRTAGKSDSIVSEPKQPRKLKGVMVRFTNKAGEEIVGFGTEYYVVRMNGKLHYKQADEVTIIPEN